MKAEGIVKKIHTKTGTGKKGPWTLYRVLIDETWYGGGFNKPKFSEGDKVLVQYEEGQYGPELKNSKVLEEGAEVPAPASSGGGGGFNSQGMAWGNASNVAATLVCKMADIEALPLSAASSKAAKAKRYEEFMDLFNKLRVELYEDSLNIDRVLDKVADAGSVEENAPAPLPNDPEMEEEDDETEDDWD